MQSRPDFPVNATALQDFIDCPRRFELRHLLRQPWPAVVDEPLVLQEQTRERGIRFHRLLQRYYQGIDEKRLEALITDPVLRAWWLAHQVYAPVKLDRDQHLLAERMFRIRLENYTLTAFIDLVVISQHADVTIIDWKTGSSKPAHAFWADRIQTTAYLYVLGETLSQITTADISLSEIRMIYWFAQYPQEAVIIPYSEDMHAQGRAKLLDLLGSISQMMRSAVGKEWPKTSELRRCRYCEYRSLCDRGIAAEEDRLFVDFEDTADWEDASE